MTYESILSELCQLAESHLNKRTDSKENKIIFDLSLGKIYLNGESLFVSMAKLDKEDMAKLLIDFVFTRGFENQTVLTNIKPK